MTFVVVLTHGGHSDGDPVAYHGKGKMMSWYNRTSVAAKQALRLSAEKHVCSFIVH